MGSVEPNTSPGFTPEEIASSGLGSDKITEPSINLLANNSQQNHVDSLAKQIVEQFKSGSEDATDRASLIDHVEHYGGNGIYVIMAKNFAELNNTYSKDDVLIAKKIAELGLDRHAKTPEDRAASVIAYFLARSIVEDRKLPELDRNNLSKQVMEGAWSDDVKSLAMELANVWFIPTMDIMEIDPTISGKTDLKNRLQFSYVQKLVAKADDRVLMMMLPIWQQRLFQATHNLTPEKFAEESPEDRDARIKMAVALEGYALPFFREFSPDTLKEIKERLFLAIDPELYWYLSEKVAPIEERKLESEKIAAFVQNKLFEELSETKLFPELMSPDQLTVTSNPKELYDIRTKMCRKAAGGTHKTVHIINKELYQETLEEVDDISRVRITIPDAKKRFEGSFSLVVDENENKRRCLAVGEAIKRVGEEIKRMKDDFLDGKKNSHAVSDYRALHLGVGIKKSEVDPSWLEGGLPKWNKERWGTEFGVDKLEVQICSQSQHDNNQSKTRHPLYKNPLFQFLSNLKKMKGVLDQDLINKSNDHFIFRFIGSSDELKKIMATPPSEERDNNIESYVNNVRNWLEEGYDGFLADCFTRILARANGAPVKRAKSDTIIVSDLEGHLWEMPNGMNAGCFATLLHPDFITAQKVVLNGKCYDFTHRMLKKHLKHGDHLYVKFRNSVGDLETCPSKPITRKFHPQRMSFFDLWETRGRYEFIREIAASELENDPGNKTLRDAYARVIKNADTSIARIDNPAEKTRKTTLLRVKNGHTLHS